MLNRGCIFRLDVPKSFVLGSEVASNMGSAAISAAHMANAATDVQQQAGAALRSDTIPLHQPSSSLHVTSLQPSASSTGRPPAVSGPAYASGSGHAVRIPPQPNSQIQPQIHVPPAMGSQPVAQSTQAAHAERAPPAAKAKHDTNASSMATHHTSEGRLSAGVQQKPAVSHASPSGYREQPGLSLQPALQHSGCSKQAAGGAAAASAVIQSTQGDMPHGTGNRAAYQIPAAQPNAAAQQPKYRQGCQNAAGVQPQAANAPAQQAGAKFKLRLLSQGSGAEQSFVPQALHHLASNCSSQAGVQSRSQASRTAQAAGYVNADVSADAAVQVRAEHGTKRGRHTASPLTATSTSASQQKAPISTGTDPGDGSTESTSQQHSALLQQKQQLNAILSSLQLPSIESMDLSSSEDLSFGDIPSEDDGDSEACSSGTAAVSDSNDSSREDESKGDSFKDDSTKDDKEDDDDDDKDDDAEYKPGGQRASRKKPGKAKGQKNRKGGRQCGRKRGNRHITMKFLEEGGYFDAPIQVCCLSVLSACMHACMHAACDMNSPEMYFRSRYALTSQE